MTGIATTDTLDQLIVPQHKPWTLAADDMANSQLIRRTPSEPF
jgi:hypothetical protein